MTDEFRDGGVLAVFARPDHPVGYGYCQGAVSQYGHHAEAKAHGYVTVIVMCHTWPEFEEVKAKLSHREWDKDGGYKAGFDPWKRGDLWYAGPYELVWVAQVDGKVRHEGGMHGDIEIGARPSYGDNRAMAYLTADEVLTNDA